MEICWGGPSPGAGKSSEVPELKFTKLRIMGLSMKAKGLVKENLFHPMYVELGALSHSDQPWDLVSEHGLGTKMTQPWIPT